MRKSNFFVLFLLLALSFNSCKTKSKISDILPVLPLSEKELVKRVNESRPDISSIFYRRSVVKFQTENENQTFRSNIYLKTDSSIIVSILAPLGIEVARICFKPHEVIIIERMNRLVVYTGYDDVSKKIKVDVDFYFLQNLFMNQPFSFFQNKDISLNDYHGGIENNQYKLVSLKERRFNKLIKNRRGEETFLHRLWIDPDGFFLRRTSFARRRDNFNVNIVYDNFHKESREFYFPEGFTVEGTREGKNFLFEIAFGNLVFNDDNGLSFNIPDKYEKIYR